MAKPALSAARAALIGVSAALATRDGAVIREALRQAAGPADAAAVDEVILQSHLFVGFPDALNVLVTWRELVVYEPADEAEDPNEWERRGPEVCKAVYGSNYSKLRSNVRNLHPDLDRWMVVGGYGRVIGRGGLDLVTRELCIAALLAVWGVPRQLHSHLRGALNVGASVAEVEQAMEIAAALLDPTSAAAVHALWQQVRAANQANGSLQSSVSSPQPTAQGG
jgi:4-carboxymuconolactone decarboxylase